MSRSIQFEEVPGLRFKAWISDEVAERWGAVYTLGVGAARLARSRRAELVS